MYKIFYKKLWVGMRTGKRKRTNGRSSNKLSHGPDFDISVNDPFERRALNILLLGHAIVVVRIITLIIILCLAIVGSILAVAAAAVGILGLACRLSLDFAVLAIIQVVVGTKADPPLRVACDVVVALRRLVVDEGCWQWRVWEYYIQDGLHDYILIHSILDITRSVIMPIFLVLHIVVVIVVVVLRIGLEL